VVILHKGRPTKYPMHSYLYWRKTVRGKSIATTSKLEDVLQMTERKQFAAQPVDEKDPASPWLTGRPKAIKAVRKVLGQSDYTAHAGCYTGGANGVYWVDIIDKRPDGLVLVANITKGAKRQVESVQIAIEPDLLYPLLRGRDVKRWQAEPSAYIILTHEFGMGLNAIPENEMKTRYPKTYQYLKRFEGVLRERAAYKRYFRPEAPFYSMFDVGDYTFAPYKVVIRQITSKMQSAVIGKLDDQMLRRVEVMPNHKLLIVGCAIAEEAHYICALLNSRPPSLFAKQVMLESGYSTEILGNIRIPKFDSGNKVHQELAGLSQNAHYAVSIGDEAGLREIIEPGIDELAAQIWGLTKEELNDIKTSLEEMT